MTATAAAIAAAILLCQPNVGHVAAGRLATVLVEEAHQHHFDAMTAAALVCHESRWRPWAVSADGEDFGLGQIRARYFGGCRGDVDPVGHPSVACLATKSALLEPTTNLRITADAIGRWTRTCRSKTGRRISDPLWLAGYAGISRPQAGQWCGLYRRLGRWTALPKAKAVREILRFRQRLASGQRPPLLLSPRSR